MNKLYRTYCGAINAPRVIYRKLWLILLLSFFSVGTYAATELQHSPTGYDKIDGTTVTFTLPVEDSDERYYNLVVMLNGGIIANTYGYVSTSYGGAAVGISGFPDNGTTYSWAVAWSDEDLSGGAIPRSSYGSYFFVNGPSAKPATPSQLSAQSSAGQPTDVVFTWNQSARAAEYTLQVYSDSSFNNLIAGGEVGLANNVTINGFPDNGSTYYWRVKASNNEGDSSFSSDSFTNGPSAVPSVPSSVNVSSNGSDVSFQWQAAARASSYRLEVAVDAAFTQEIFDQNIGNYIGTSFTTFPNNDQTYYYRVSAVNSRGSSSTSSTQSFVNTATSRPSEPSLTSPSSGANKSGENVNFSWQSASRAYDYTFEISANSNFENSVTETFRGININVGMPENDMTLYWRVKANNSSGSSAWVSRSFVSAASSIPQPVTIISPANGSTTNSDTVEFRWDPSAGSSQQTFEFSQYPNMANAGSEEMAGNINGLNIPGFPHVGLTYYWRVFPENSVGRNNNAIINSFTDGYAPSAPTNITPNSGIVNDVQLTLSWDMPYNAVWINYTLEYDGVSQGQTSNIQGSRTVVASNPEPGTEVRVGMQAGNYAGESSWTYVSFQYKEANSTGCVPSAASMWGNIESHDHVDVCEEDGTTYLKDVSRRDSLGDLADHNHDGWMSETSSIFTGVYDGSSIATETDANSNSGLVDAHANAAKMYDYLRAVQGINSYDHDGSSMRSVVDKSCYSSGGSLVDNAFWSPTDKLVTYCEEANLTYPLSVTLDVVGHEWAHAVTSEFAGGLRYQYDSGALNEAFSDWAGVALEAYNGNVNMTMGEDSGQVFRDISNPMAHNQPAAYGTNYLYFFNTETCTEPNSGLNDNCGVHTNSGVGNKMFHLLAYGGTHMGVTIEDHEKVGIETAMKIALSANIAWEYETTYEDAREDMIQAVFDPELNLDASIALVVAKAWDAVRVGVPSYNVALAVNDVAAGTIGYRALEDGVTANLLSNPFNLNDILTIEATANSGHSLLHFEDQNGNVLPNLGSASLGYVELPALSSDITITAVFSTEATVAVISNGGGSVSGAGTYLVGEWVTLVATANTGALFDGWTGLQGLEVDGDASQASIRVRVPAGGLTVTANFLTELYSINVTVSGNGQVSGAGDYPPNSLVDIAATADAQNVFSGWSGDVNLGPVHNPLTVEIDHSDWSLIALFTPDVDDNELPDDWENEHDVSDPSGDADGDGVTNLEEYQMGLDPNNTDSDFDGFSDSEEIARGTDPLVWDMSVAVLIPIFYLLMQ